MKKCNIDNAPIKKVKKEINKKMVIPNEVINIPDSIRTSVEDNFTSYFRREFNTFNNDNNDIITKIKAFIRIAKRFKGFEGQVVLYHNKNVRDIYSFFSSRNN